MQDKTRNKIKKALGLVGYSLIGTGRLTQLRKAEKEYKYEKPFLQFSRAIGRLRNSYEGGDGIVGLSVAQDLASIPEEDLEYVIARYSLEVHGMMMGDKRRNQMKRLVSALEWVREDDLASKVSMCLENLKFNSMDWIREGLRNHSDSRINSLGCRYL